MPITKGMAGPHPDTSVVHHIASITRRTTAEGDRLLHAVSAHCWPSGTADRAQPPGREWARRWRSAARMAPAVVCACATGPCAVCN